MTHERRKPADIRRHGSRRRDAETGQQGRERRAKAVVRDAGVLEIALPPLKAPRDRRGSERRRGS